MKRAFALIALAALAASTGCQSLSMMANRGGGIPGGQVASGQAAPGAYAQAGQGGVALANAQQAAAGGVVPAAYAQGGNAGQVDCGQCVCNQCQCQTCQGQGCGQCCLCRGSCCLCGFCCQVVDPSGVVYNTNPIYAMRQTMRSDAAYQFNPGPSVGQTAYPYYTVRGPRDFLQSNPAPLGPY